MDSKINKGLLPLFGVTTAVIGLSIAALFTRPQNGGAGSSAAIHAPVPSAQEVASVDYHLGRIIRSSAEPYEVTVIISIDQKYFVHDKMVKLARQLKQDFREVPILRVEIMDDRNIADNYIPAGDMYRLFNKAKRGTYRLNRNTKEEYIEFSRGRGEPVDQVRTDLTGLEKR